MRSVSQRYAWTLLTGARHRAERAARGPPTVEPDPGQCRRREGSGSAVAVRAPRRRRRRRRRRSGSPSPGGPRSAACARVVLDARRGRRVARRRRHARAGHRGGVRRGRAARARPASAARYPAFCAELRGVGRDRLRRTGTLVVARDRDEAEALDRLLALRRELGLPVERLRPSAGAPRASPRSRRRSALALDVPGDHAVDPRAARRRAAPSAVERAGGEIAPRSRRVEGERVTGVGSPTASGPRRAVVLAGRRARSSGAARRRCRCRPPGQGPDPAAARSRGPGARRRARSARATATSSRAATAATCSARRWRSAAGTPRRPPAASSSCSATSPRSCPGVLELEIEELRRRPAARHARQPAGHRRRRASRACLGDRPLPQRDPARAGDRRAGRRRARRRGLPEWAAPCDPRASREVRRRERARQRRADRARDRRDGQAVLAALELPAASRGVAVAVDAEVVPRGEWAAHELERGRAGRGPARDPGRMSAGR